MTVLSAALAFAITMLILSMVTSVFVETIHRFIGLRERGLQLMVGHVYDRIIAPYIAKQGINAAALKTEFVELMTVNRAPSGVAGGASANLASNASGVDSGLLSRIWSGRRLARLSAEQFMSRLGGSAYGDHLRDAIKTAGLDDPDQALKDIASRFDQFGREASVFFERRARLVSVLAAIAVAWLMYVHPYELFKTYMTNSAVADAVISLERATLAEYEAEFAKAEDVAGKAKDSGDEAAIKAAGDALAQARAKMTEKTRSLQEIGVPIGWTKERLNMAGFSDNNFVGVPWPSKSRSIRTIIWLLLGGLLVGLGGPFWYDMVKSLSSIRTILGGPKSVANTGAPDTQVSSSDTAPPQTAVDHFHAASAGRDAAELTEPEEEEAVG